MGFFDRFKGNDTKKEKKQIPEDIEIDQDQLLLKEIAINSKDRTERAIAADKITDQFVALDIAKNVKDRAIRLIASVSPQSQFSAQTISIPIYSA